MAYPLIIFGAGASHDYSPLGKLAPLTKELVENQFLYEDLLEKYRGAANVLADLIQRVKQGNKTFEQELTAMKERTKDSKQMRAHFSALEFYLRDLFKKISNEHLKHIPRDIFLKMRQANNYKRILNRIDTYTAGRACVITFNYDSLFENNLYKAPIIMNDYIANDLKIIKVHGSHDWVYIKRSSSMRFHESEAKNSFEWCLENPDFLDELRTDGRPIHEQELQRNNTKSDFADFPAIAIPLIGKDSYICPESHIQILTQVLPKIDRVLVIGWRAGDPLLLDILKSHLQEMGYTIMVVSDTLDGAHKIGATIKTALGIDKSYITAIGGGFSDFMANETSETFFAQ